MKFKSILSLLLTGILFVGCSDSGGEPDPEPTPDPTPTPVVAAGEDMLIYEANPRFYAESNCLKALADRLDEMQEMGINVLWMMPVCEPGVKNAFGSPYCIKDFKAINPKYGSIADMKDLVDKAHAKGMKVILDWIANHTSWDNTWITEHKDWYTQDSNGNVISPAGMGWNDVADLNFNKADMRDAMIDAMSFWVTSTGIDGFRCDYAEGVPHDFWKDAITELHKLNADLLMLAESGDDSFYGDGFDMIYGWDYNSKLQSLFNGKTKVASFYEYAEKEMNEVPEGKHIMRYAINHDVAAENTVASLYGNHDAMIAAYALTAMIGGVPMIYSAQESNYSGKISFFDYNPLTWDSSKTAKYAEINQAFIKSKNIRGGELKKYETDKVATFALVAGSNALLVMVNTSNSDATIKVPMAYSGVSMTNLLTGSTSKMPIAMDLKPYEYCFFMK